MPETGIYAGVPVIYQPDIRAAATQYGIPERALVQLLSIESDHFAPDVISGKRKSSAGAIGVAQFMPGTAQSEGIDPTDPIQSIYGAARLLQKYGGGDPKNPTPLTPDQLKVAVASYVSGPGTVAKAMKAAALNALSDGEKDWTKVWPTLTNDPSGTAKYLDSITSGIPTSAERGLAPGGGTAGGTTTGFQEPQLKDFELIDPQSGQPTGRYDSAAYNRAMAEFRRFSGGDYGQDQPKGTDFGSFLDTVVAQIGQQMKAGELDVTKANNEFNRRMSAFDTASKNFNANLGYAIPAGATKVPGTNIDITGQTVEYNPFKEALGLVNSTPDLTQIQTPGPPSPQNMFQQALDLYRQGVGAGVSRPLPGVGAGTTAPGGTYNPPVASSFAGAPVLPPDLNTNAREPLSPEASQPGTYAGSTAPLNPDDMMSDEERRRRAYLWAQAFAGSGAAPSGGGGSF